MIENVNADLKPPDSATALFSDSAVDFLARYRVWIVAAVWLGFRGFAIWGLSPNYSIETYIKLAGDWLDGYTPYVAFRLEYPPGALLLMTLPRFFTDSPIVYGYIFASVMLLADLIILVLCWRLPALRHEGNDIPNREMRYESTLLCLTYILFTAVFGRLLFQNYDLLMGMLLATAIYFARRKKMIPVDLLLAAGIWFSLAAVYWLPLFWWYGMVSRHRSSETDQSIKPAEWIRSLLMRLSVFAAGLAVLYLPFVLLAGRSLGQIVQFQLERGTQLESTASSILILGAKLFDFELSTDFSHRAIHLTGDLAAAGARVCEVVSVAVLLLFSAYAAWRMLRDNDPRMHFGWLMRGLLAASLTLLATSKIFLPQHLLWICPLAALIANSYEPRLSRTGWHLFGVFLVSVVLFFFFYPDLIELHVLPGLLLLIRNLLVIGLAIVLLLPQPNAAKPPGRQLQISSRTRKYLLYLPVILLFSWGTLSAFRPIRNPDVWMNLRVAEDILATGEIPTVDTYSAVAAGRPLIIHEWLSAFIFLGIFKLGGGEALSVFRAAIFLAMLLFLWFSLERHDRRFILTAPILALVAYVILERIFVRPHAFTLLFLCVWVYCIEHWRRERRLRYLILLVPLQALWANLHGGYLIGLVLAAMLTGVTAVLAWRPSWSRCESYTWSDAARFAGLTVACLAACFINPHGLRLLEFSLTMAFSSDFINQYVYEWGSPLADKYTRRAYGFNLILSIAILMWSGLALSAKRRPLMDAAFALLATAITVQAIRFVPFIGILGFAATIRAWRSVAEAGAGTLPVTRRPVLETALFGFIIASTLIYGFPYDKSNHRRIGWGFGGRLPNKTVEFMQERNFEGVIFNDYADGAVIIHHLSPGVRPVIDPRIDIYGSDLTHEYFSSRKDPVKFFRYLNKYNVSFILLLQNNSNFPFINMLSQLP